MVHLKPVVHVKAASVSEHNSLDWWNRFSYSTLHRNLCTVLWSSLYDTFL